MNVSLRQLRLFEATCRLGTLSAAADEQAISQPAASQAVRELENTLGYALFARSGRYLQATDGGRRVLPRVREIMALVDGLHDPAGERVGGDFHVAASVTVGSYLLPGLLAEFCRRHPAIEPRITLGNSESIMQMLESEQAQIGFIEGPARATALTVRHWRRDQLCVFSAPGHTLASRPCHDVAALAGARWILRESGSGARQVFDAAARVAGFSPVIALTLPRQEAIKQAVRAGLGIGCLPEVALADEIAAGQLVPIRTPLMLERELSWVAPPPARMSSTLQAFLALLATEA